MVGTLLAPRKWTCCLSAMFSGTCSIRKENMIIIAEKIRFLWGELFLLQLFPLPSGLCAPVLPGNTNTAAGRSLIQCPLFYFYFFTWAILTPSYIFVLAFSWTDVKTSLLVSFSQTTALVRHRISSQHLPHPMVQLQGTRRNPGPQLSSRGGSACPWMLCGTDDDVQEKTSVSGFG